MKLRAKLTNDVARFWNLTNDVEDIDKAGHREISQSEADEKYIAWSFQVLHK